MHQKCFPNHYPKFNLIYLPKFNLLSLYLSHSSTVKIQKIKCICIRNVSEMYQIQPFLPRSQSFKYYIYSKFIPKFNLLSLYLSKVSKIKHTYTVHHNYLYLFQIYPKIQPSLPISQSLKYCKNPKNPKFSQMHQKCFPNLSQIQPFLPTSQSFKYCKYQIKHTQFIIIIYIYSKFIPKFNLLSLYLSHSSTVKIQK